MCKIPDEAVQAVPTSELTKALSRMAGNRHSDGVSSIVSADDRSVIINECHDMMLALRTMRAAPFLQGVKVDAQGIYDYVQSYEWRGDNGDYTPNDADREMLEDAIVGYLSSIEGVHTTHPLSAPSPRAQALEEAKTSATHISGLIDQYAKAAFDQQGKGVPRYVWDAHFREFATALAALSSQPVADGWLPTHRHKKRGTEYRVIGTAQVQCSDGLTDYEVVTVYVGQDNQMWVRRTPEFEDGRFEALPASPGASTTNPTGGSDANS